MLTQEQLAKVKTAAVEHFQKNLARLKAAGFVLRESRPGYVKADIIMGGERVQDVREFAKANIADDKWSDVTLVNADPYVTKAQYRIAISAAVADLPL